MKLLFTYTCGLFKRDHCRITFTLIFFILLLPVLIGCADKKKHTRTAQHLRIAEVQIGKQVWSAKNLDLVTFRNGDTIPHVTSAEEWVKAGRAGQPAWCYYNNDTGIGKKYGRMYNWYAVNDPRGLCPEGWHVATNDEWIELENHVGVEKAAVLLKSNEGWNDNGNGDSRTTFAIVPGGYRDRNGRFTGQGEFTYLSSATQEKLPDADGFFIWGRGVNFENPGMMRCGLDKEFGLYVRCVRDMSESSEL
jgi:uncharacterized protein (TIGR02145 family)